jgi:CheY-like chemotaxis protein
MSFSTPMPGGRHAAVPPYTVLVADGDSHAADATAHLLSQHGLEARAAYDGPEAIGLARRTRPKAVVADIALPGVTGFDVARELRRTFGAAIRLVACAPGPVDPYLATITEAGFDSWVTREPDPMDLIRAVSPTLHETVAKSISVNVRQIRNQLILASSLLDHAGIVGAGAMQARIHDFLRARIEGVVSSMGKLPIGGTERRELMAQVEAIRERLQR